MPQHVVLSIDHTHPKRAAILHKLTAHPRDLAKRAAEALRSTADRLGVSPLALAWSVETVGVTS